MSTLMTSRCVACLSPTHATARNGRFTISNCSSCGTRSLIEPAPFDASVDQDETAYVASYGGTIEDVVRRRVSLVSRYADMSRPVLDFGGSFGHVAAAIRDAGYRVAAVERSLLARRGLEARSISVVDLDAGTGELFGSITAWHVIEHIDDPASALMTLRQHLVDDGTLIIAVPNAKGLFASLSLEHWVWAMPWHRHYFSRIGLEALLSRCGFKVRDVSSDVGDPCALEITFAGLARVTPSRLSSELPAQNEKGPSKIDTRQPIVRVLRYLLRTASMAIQRVAATFSVGEELLVVARAI